MDKLDLQDKKVAILGIGTEGLALAGFLIDKSEQLTILDKLSEEGILERLEGKEQESFKTILNNSQINQIFGPEYLDDLGQYDVIFRSPGIPFFNPKIQEAMKSGVTISSQIKLFFQLCPCKIIGVTGTKGKGTTASLISEILKKNTEYRIQNTASSQEIYLAGNIGYPAITLIPNLTEDDIVILELSSFQLIDLDKSPHIAVVTNLSEDHLDYHENLEEYQNAKFNILKFQTEDDFAILNKQSTFLNKLLESGMSAKKYFSNKNLDSRLRGNDNNEREDDGLDAVVRDNAVILDPNSRNIKICDQSDIKLYGVHNLENIAAATLATDILDIDPDVIKKTIKEFSGLPHRLEFVAEINGVKYINDSYATNPEPTMAAINSFSENKILILGGSSKGADFSKLTERIVSDNVPTVILIDPEGFKIKNTLVQSGYKGKFVEGMKNIDEIVERAFFLAKNGDIVILSPACASFGMFKNYKERGEKFKTAVLRLAKQ